MGDNPTDQQKSDELAGQLLHYLKGDKNAVKYCMDLVYIAHLWDDLIDRDVERTDTEIGTAFRLALFDIPYNPFFVKHIMDLRPLMMNVIIQWQDANVLEKGTTHDKHMAYMLRAGIIQIFCYCAYLKGGTEWAEQVGPDIRRIYKEEMADFLKEFENA